MALNEAGFEKTSPIQEMTLIPILDGKDVFAQAETGSGKTGAFAIPILHQILSSEMIGQIGEGKAHYAVLSPTRELAQQTHSVFQKFADKLGVKSVCIIGGESIITQKKLIGEGVHILVGTPGRLRDLINQREVDLSECKGIVFDEADRLFDMGFKNDIEYILSKAPESRQLIMVSATSNIDVLTTAYKFRSNPEEIRINTDKLVVDKIDHKLAMMSLHEKFPFLVNILQKQIDTYAIVFCNTQFQTHLVAEWLIAMGFKAKPISGRLPQSKRTRLLDDFRAKKTTILVCTDVAARGLDIKSVPLVVNYDLPSEASNYVHRIGRTGRAGEDGLAISLCAHEDCEHLDAIYEFIDATIPKLPLTDDDFAKNICKKPYLDYHSLRLIENTKATFTPPKKEYLVKKITTPLITSPNVKTETTMTQKKNFSKPQTRPQTPVLKAPKEFKEVKTETPRLDKRFFEIKNASDNEAQKKALGFFNISDASLLKTEILKQGGRKFFFFGPRTGHYKFSLKQEYKTFLTPYLSEIFRLAKLELNFDIVFKDPELKITFAGADSKLLAHNENELLLALEQLVRLYLYQKIVLHPNIRIIVGAQGLSTRPERKTYEEADLIEMAEKLKAEVTEKKRSLFTEALSPAQRRIIHMQFQDDARFKTSSVGEDHFKMVKINWIGDN